MMRSGGHGRADVGRSVKRKEVPEGTRGRVDRVVQELTGLSRAGVFGLFDHGCVTLNGAPCDEAGAEAKAGDVVEVRYDSSRRYKPIPPARADRAFRIVFEDEHLLVAAKSAGVLTVPTYAQERDTLVHKLAMHAGARVEVVHRLDRDTSGLLVFGKSRAIAEALQKQFREHKPDRQYVAIVAGVVELEAGTFDTLLATDERLHRYSTDDEGEGERAVTHYAVERRMPGATLVRVRLETGRRNQIRVHFAEAGHPVIGDRRYDSKRAGHNLWDSRRLALHAEVLGFRHPVTGAAVSFKADLPRAFILFLAAAKRAGLRAKQGEQTSTS